MTGSVQRGLVLALVALLLVPTTATAAVQGSPDISLTVADNRVVAGETTALGVTVVNAGNVDVGSSVPGAEARVTTARGLTLDVGSGDAPISVRTGTVAVGSVPEGAVGPANVQIVVDEDARPGTYRVPVEVSYTYTSNVAERNVLAHDEDRVIETLFVTVVVEAAPRFEITAAATDAPVGGSGAVTLTLRNAGTATADATTVALESSTGEFAFATGGVAETFVGALAPNASTTLSFPARVAGGTERRPLALRSTITYEDPDGIARQETLTAGVTPASAGRFSVVGGETTASAGGTGTYTVGVRNDGPAVRDVTLTLTSTDPSFSFGGARTASTTVGRLSAGETREIAVPAAFAAGATERAHVVEAVVDYTTQGGRQASDRPVTLGVAPADEQSFAVEGSEAELRVGAEGSLSGTLVNEGPGAVSNAVLIVEPAGRMSATETEVALGDLAVGDAAAFDYDVEVSAAARPGPRQFTYRVRYEDSNDETVTSDPLYVRATVGEKRQVFDVTSETTVEAGETTALVVTVTNNEDQPLSDISAKLFADDQLSATNDEAFVDELGPGETAELVFEISAAKGTLPKTYPVSLDFQYDEPDGDTKLSDTFQVPVEVTEREGGGLLFVGDGPVAVGGVAVGALGIAVLARRL